MLCFYGLLHSLLILTFIIVSKSYKKSLIPHGFTNFIETIIVFVRDEIVKPTIGHGYEKFLPYLLTAFFFILFSNFIGLIPCTATVTSNIAVTATLAGFTFFATQIGGIIHHGPIGYFKGLNSSGNARCLVTLNCTCRNFWSLHKTICIVYSSFCKYDRRPCCYSFAYRINFYYEDDITLHRFLLVLHYSFIFWNY